MPKPPPASRPALWHNLGMPGERWYITGLIVSLLALSLVILGFRWSTLAARVPLAPAEVESSVQPQPAAASARAGSAPDGAQAHPSAEKQGKAAHSGRLDINQATAAQLEELPGIGPVLAARIVAWREAHGAFASVAALQRVAGIGAGKLKAIEELVYAGPAD
jgi:competence protein ComEA